MITISRSRVPDPVTVHGFLAYLQSLGNFEQWELDFIADNIHVRKLAKGSTLLDQGDISNFYFVTKGCLRTFYIKENGNELIRCIALENSFCWAPLSFLNQAPSNESIDALCDTEVIVITKRNLDRLNANSTSFKKAYQKGLEMLCISYAAWLETFLTMDAKLRYDHLLAKNSLIVQRLPNKIVASYLGITQETLSRLKR